MTKESIAVLFNKVGYPDVFANCPECPYLKNPSVSCPFPGSCAEILLMLTEYLNWTIISVMQDPKQNDDFGQVQPNGSYSGMVGYLTRGEVDTIATLTQYSAVQNSPFELSYPVYNTLWQYSRYQVNQPDDDIYVYYNTSAGNWSFFVFGLLQVSLLINLYQGLLLSALLKPEDVHPFHTSEEMFALISSGRYTFVVDAPNYYSEWYVDNWNNSATSHVKQLNEALKSNPVLVTKTETEAFALLRKGGYIYPTQTDTYELYITQTYCDIYRFDADTPQVASMFMFRKNSTLLKDWNNAIIMNQDFIQRTFNKYYMEGFITTAKFPNCSEETVSENDESDKPDPIKKLVKSFFQLRK